MMTSSPEVMMTVKEVAAFLRLAPSTVYKLAQNGQIPAHKVGRGWRFSRRALTHWLDHHETPPTYLTSKALDPQGDGFFPSISSLS